jgi:hypothetical protein
MHEPSGALLGCLSLVLLQVTSQDQNTLSEMSAARYRKYEPQRLLLSQPWTIAHLHLSADVHAMAQYHVLPVISGVKRLIQLIDHDENSEGQKAAEHGRRIWSGSVPIVPLLPKQIGWDFNDVILGRKA